MGPGKHLTFRLRFAAGVLAFTFYSNVAFAGVIPGMPPVLTACHTLFNEAYEIVDAIPFTKKIMDSQLSKGWRERFDVSIYHREHERFMKMEKMGVDEWGFPETKLAYLVALIEKSTATSKMPGLKITVTDTFLDDPRHARALQLLTKDLDFSKKLSRFQLEGMVERAFVLTGKLDFKFGDLLRMDQTRFRALMREHVWKEMAKIGVGKVYADMGLMVYTSSELKAIKSEAANAILAGKKPAHLAEEIDAMQVESRVAKWKRWQKNPKVQALFLIPTWNPANMAAKLRPGVLPKVQWVRFPPEFLKMCIEIGVDNCLDLRKSGMKRFLVTQRVYDYVRMVTTVWAGAMTIGYAVGQLYDLDAEEVQDLILKQAEGPMKEVQADYERNPGYPDDPEVTSQP